MRQVAYLNAIPRTKDAEGKETKQPARLRAYQLAKAEPPLPPIQAQHLYDMLMEVGPIEPAGMGEAAIGWGTIRHWRDSTGVLLAPWEARLLRELSKAYLIEKGAAENPYQPAPWTPRGAQIDHAANERQLRAVFG